MSNNQTTIQILNRNFSGEEKLESILLSFAEYEIDKSIQLSYDLAMVSATSEEVAK